MVPYAPSAPRAFSPAQRGVTRISSALVAGLAGLFVASAACDKVPLTAPAGTVITLVSTTNVVPVNGSTEVVAVLIENGTTSTGTTTTTGAAGTPVHNGTLVTFTTSLGRIEPAEAKTLNGRVSVTLVADGRSGKAVITAFSGSATKTLEILVGAAAAERVIVTSSSPTVPASGGTVTISARVEDVTGNALAGVPVTFSTTAGTLGAATGLTNEAGIATTSLSTTAEATVTVNAGGKSASATVKVRARSTITLTAPAGSVFVGAAVTLSVAPPAGVTLTGVTIDFGDGDSQLLGTLSSARTVVHFYEDDDVYTVTVRGTDVDGGAAEAAADIAVIPFTFSATATPTSGTTSTIFVFSVTGLPASVPIERFTWNFGDGTVRDSNSPSTTKGYSQPGYKTITVTVVPRYGDSVSQTLQILVTGT